MRERLLDFLRCPDCKQKLELTVFDTSGDEISEGILHCSNEHFFPVVRGIPRMLPSSLKDNWAEIAPKVPSPVPSAIKILLENNVWTKETRAYDTRTKANFSNEWDNYDIGGKTWGMDLEHRVRVFFLESIHIPKEELNGKVMLDAGCGNGSQSVAYTEYGLEVVAVDLSTGLEKGYDFRQSYKAGKPDKVHFVQADLQNPPLAPDSFDIIHSVGVLHHTPNTKNTFDTLRALLRHGGTFYVWFYKYENIVTPVVNSIRAVTTRIPAPMFAKIADMTALPFIGFCWTVNKLGVREYGKMNHREATLAVHDIFGAPYAHYHSFEEVSDWYNSVGITEIWACNESRRGFGVCGKISTEKKEDNSTAA
ncbi:MAG: methyltransferase domain-containing protein [Acidobacteria bacterium]|nr:methyltransferase domain-containing protein [Acidobacteriota bacterium]